MNQKAGGNSNFGVKVRQCLCDVIYAFFRASLFVIFHGFFRVRIVGREHAPRAGGPLLVICNHLSEWDPPFLGAFLPWQVHWLAKVELFELLGGKMDGFFRMLHCVPVNREKADLAAIKAIVQLLRKQRPVVIFAEGGVVTNEHSVLGTKPALKEGAATMAILAGSPILPVLLNGTVSAYGLRNWFSFRSCMLEIVIGPVFRLESRDRTEATRQMLSRMLELKPHLRQQEIC